MNKIKNYFSNYFKNSSKWKIAGDAIFYLFIILMIIPASRKEISALVIKATMRKPMVEEAASAKVLSDKDYHLVFSDLSGNSFNLSDFKGEVILLNFWATWCPPCRAEMPSMQALYDSYGGKIKMILLSSEAPEVIQKYMDDHSYTMPVYIRQSQQSEAYEIPGIPTTFLISAKGEIMLRKVGAANWNSQDFKGQIDELLAAQ